MTDLPRHPDAIDETTARGRGPSANRPWWVYGLVIVVVAVLALLAVLHLTGVMGPGSH